MSTAKHVIRFTVQVTENTAFTLELNVCDLNSKSVEDFATEEAVYMQNFGHFKGIDFLGEDFTWHKKIIFAWQGWID